MSMKRALCLAVAGGLMTVLSVACAGGNAPAGGSTASKAAPAAPGDATRGKTLYGQSCTSCHGPDGKGIAGLGKPLAGSAFAKEQTDAQMLDFIKKGRPASDPANTTKIDMPAKGGNTSLSDAQIMDIIAYTKSL